MPDERTQTINRLQRELREMRGNVTLLQERTHKIVGAIARVLDTLDLIEKSDWLKEDRSEA